jgi:hypothetical protein
MFEITLLIVLLVLLIMVCITFYLIGKLKSDIEHFSEVIDKQNEFIQDRLYVLEVKLDNLSSTEEILFNVAPGKQ